MKSPGLDGAGSAIAQARAIRNEARAFCEITLPDPQLTGQGEARLAGSFVSVHDAHFQTEDDMADQPATKKDLDALSKKVDALLKQVDGLQKWAETATAALNKADEVLTKDITSVRDWA